MSTTYQLSRRTFYVGDPDRNYGIVWPNAIDADLPSRNGFIFSGDSDDTEVVFTSAGGTPYAVTALPFKVHLTDVDRWFWRGFVIPDSVPQGNGYILKLNDRTLANNITVATPTSYNAWQTISFGSSASTINSAIASGQPTANRLRFEPGLYEIDTPIVLYANTLIDGGGAILRPAAGFTGSCFGMNNVSRVTLRNFVFQDWNVNGESRRLIDHSGSGYGPHLVVKKCRFEATQLGIFDQTSDVGLVVRDNLFHRSSVGIAATGLYAENSFNGQSEVGQEFTISNASNLAVFMTTFDRTRRGFTLANSVTKVLVAWFWATQGGTEPNAGEFINFEGAGSETLESIFIGGRTHNWPGNLTLFDQAATRCMFSDFDIDRAGVDVWGTSAQTGNIFDYFQMRHGGFRFNIDSEESLATHNQIRNSAFIDFQFDRLNQTSAAPSFYSGDDRPAVIYDITGLENTNNNTVEACFGRGQPSSVKTFEGMVFEGSENVPTPPEISDNNKTTGQLTVIDHELGEVEGAQVYARVKNMAGINGIWGSGAETGPYLSDANGLVQIPNLIKGAIYRFRIVGSNKNATFTVPMDAGATVTIGGLVY